MHDAFSFGSWCPAFYTVALRSYLRCTLRRDRRAPASWLAASACNVQLHSALNLHVSLATFVEWKSIECFMSARGYISERKAVQKKSSLCVILNVSLLGGKNPIHICILGAREHSALLWYILFIWQMRPYFIHIAILISSLFLFLSPAIFPLVFYIHAHIFRLKLLCGCNAAFKGSLIKY